MEIRKRTMCDYWSRDRRWLLKMQKDVLRLKAHRGASLRHVYAATLRLWSCACISISFVAGSMTLLHRRWLRPRDLSLSKTEIARKEDLVRPQCHHLARTRILPRSTFACIPRLGSKVARRLAHTSLTITSGRLSRQRTAIQRFWLLGNVNLGSDASGGRASAQISAATFDWLRRQSVWSSSPRTLSGRSRCPLRTWTTKYTCGI